jgi:very-short-patch-repair endonuclease
MNNQYNPNLKKYANDLRNQSVSRAEKYLWKAGLRAKQVGVAFKRQRPIDRFIVDFFSAEVNLIIEVDGSSHDAKGSYDRYRQDRLESLGYTVIRFQEGEVIHSYPEVEDKIRRAIEVLKSRLREPQPTKIREP